MRLLNDAIKVSRQGSAACQTNVITLLQRTLTSWETDWLCIPTVQRDCELSAALVRTLIVEVI